MIKLTITEKGGEPKALSFDKDEVSIGRVSGNDIVLPKGNVSKRHTRLSIRAGQVEIADLKSTNGTYVNGRKISEPMYLAGTDRVYVGDFLITVDTPGAADGASSSRRLPVPPPPPPSRTGSGVSRPLDDTGMGEEEEQAPLAAKPPRSSPRVAAPPPPPPPPRRQPTPLASAALEGDEHEEQSLAAELSEPAPREVAPDDTTGSAGLFERRPSADHAAFDGAGGRAATTGRRPGGALPAEPPPAPTFERPASVESAAASIPGIPANLEGLEALLADPEVAQIVIAGPDAAYVDRGNGFVAMEAGLGDPNALADVLWRMANAAVPPPPPDNPVVDVRLPDGTRIAAVFPPAAPAGVVASIRKVMIRERPLADLVPPGARELQTVLEAAVGAQRNLLCTGDPSALAAFFGALATAIPSDRRVVAIGAPVTSLRAGWSDLAPSADMAALVRVAAALRPNHLLSGESVGAEALDLLLAATRGQEGLALALPARGTGEALARLEALAAPPAGTGSGSTAALIASTIDLVVQVVSTSDGTLRVVEVAEPTLGEGGRLRAVAVATWQGDGGRRGSASGRLEVHGVSGSLGASFADAGHALPSSLVRK